MNAADRRESMRLCSDHWSALYSAMTEASPTHVPPVSQQVRAAQEMIVGNAAFLASDKNHLIDNGCPVCLLNAEHKAHCGRSGCASYYDVLIEHAAEQMAHINRAFASIYPEWFGSDT